MYNVLSAGGPMLAVSTKGYVGRTDPTKGHNKEETVNKDDGGKRDATNMTDGISTTAVGAQQAGKERTVSDSYTLRLPRVAVYQLLDGADIRAEAWEFTARYMSGKYAKGDEDRMPEECSDADEAGEIARHYRSIQKKIKRQIRRQRARQGGL